MEQAILTEAFKAFDALNEETFPATQEGEEALKKFMDNDISDELEVVIDPDAETEEDIKETYVGDVILNCPVCQSKIYKKPEDVTIDEEKDLANVEEDCPYCQTSGGFEIVGQVAEFDASKPTVKVDGEEVEEEEDDDEDKEDIGESLRRRPRRKLSEVYVGPSSKGEYKKLKDYFLKAYTKDVLDAYRDVDPEDLEDGEDWFDAMLSNELDEMSDYGVEDGYVDEDSWEWTQEYNYKLNPKYQFKETSDAEDFYENLYRCWVLSKREDKEDIGESLGSDLGEYQKWVDYDMKKYGRISDTTNEKIKKAGLEVVKDKYGDYQVIAQSKKGMKESIKRPIRRRRNHLGENFQNVDVDTDNEHIRVSSEGEKTSVEVEPKKGFEGARRGDEFIEPVDEETKTEIEATSEPEEEDITIEDIDEESFDELGESYLKRTYDNVVSYRTTRGAIKGNKMFLEGIIKFKSGKEKKTTFVFESYSISRKRKVKLLGENVNFTKNKKAFAITGSVRDKKLTVESFNYNYTAKDARTGASKRLYGTVKR